MGSAFSTAATEYDTNFKALCRHRRSHAQTQNNRSEQLTHHGEVTFLWDKNPSYITKLIDLTVSHILSGPTSDKTVYYLHKQMQFN